MPPEIGKPFHAGDVAKAGIAGEQFVSTQTGKRHLDSGGASLARRSDMC